MHPEVLDKDNECHEENFGNPSSIHYFGREARKVLNEARKSCPSIGAREVKSFLQVVEQKLIISIIGVAHAYRHKGKHLITTSN